MEIQASKPIVPFRETAIKAAGELSYPPTFINESQAHDRSEMAPPKYSSKRGLVHGSNAQGLVKFSIRATPMPKPLLEFILDNISVLKRLQRERGNMLGSSLEYDYEDDAARERSYDDSGETFRKPTVRPDQFWAALEEVCKKAGGDWDMCVVDRIWAFGPHKAGGCLLIDARKNIKTPNS